MKAYEEQDIHLGNNIKHLIRAFQMTQAQLAEKLGMPDSHLSHLLKKADIDSDILQQIADAIGNGVTIDMIKAYSHDDTISYIINNYTQNVESGATGNFKNDNSPITTSTFQEGSQPTINHYVAEQVFEFLKENADLKTEIMRLRMKYEPDSVENELKNKK